MQKWKPNFSGHKQHREWQQGVAAAATRRGRCDFCDAAWARAVSALTKVAFS